MLDIWLYLQIFEYVIKKSLLFSNLKRTFIYCGQGGGKASGFWLELFIGQVPAVSACLHTTK